MVWYICFDFFVIIISYLFQNQSLLLAVRATFPLLLVMPRFQQIHVNKICGATYWFVWLLHCLYYGFCSLINSRRDLTRNVSVVSYLQRRNKMERHLTWFFFAYWNKEIKKTVEFKCYRQYHLIMAKLLLTTKKLWMIIIRMISFFVQSVFVLLYLFSNLRIRAGMSKF